MRHPACDFARSVMQVALAGTGRLAVGRRHQRAARRRHGPRRPIHRAWRLHYDDIRHSLDQRASTRAGTCTRRSWSRATPRSTRSSSRASTRRRSACATSSRKAAQATLVGEVFDDAATGQGLLNFFLRALNCGAVREEEIGELTGLTLEELRSGSFVKIVKGRRAETRRRPVTRSQSHKGTKQFVSWSLCLRDFVTVGRGTLSGGEESPPLPTRPESARRGRRPRTDCHRSPSGNGC